MVALGRRRRGAFPIGVFLGAAIVTCTVAVSAGRAPSVDVKVSATRVVDGETIQFQITVSGGSG